LLRAYMMVCLFICDRKILNTMLVTEHKCQRKSGIY